eukprot:GILI01022564.1.p1 GENE.GILI01022564.1~~GILI01022564.1.p1  ORF type:complete len:681 (+),score=189.18 GILI01022564.1:506-2548(+)
MTLKTRRKKNTKMMKKRKRNESLSNSLKILRFVAGFVIIGLCVATFFTYSISTKAFASFVNTFEWVLHSSERRSSVLIGAYSARTLALLNQGFFNSSMKPLLEAEAKDQIMGVIDHMEGDHRRMYDAGDWANYQPLALLHTQKVIPLIDYVEGNKYIRYYNIFDAGLAYLARLKQLVKKDLSEITPDSDDIRFIVENSLGSLLTSFNKSAFLYEETTSHAADILVNEQLIVFLVIIGLYIFLSLIVFIPRIRTLHLQLNNLLGFFRLSVPHREIRDLVEVYRGYYEQFVEFQVNKDDFMGDVLFKPLSDEASSLLKADVESLASRVAVDTKNNSASNTSSKGKSGPNSGANSAAARARRKKKQSDQQVTHAYQVYLFVVVLGLVVFGYFFGMFQWIDSNSEISVRFTREIHWSAYRHLFLKRSLFKAREFIASTNAPYSPQVKPSDILADALASVNDGRNTEEDLLYGNPSYDLFGVARRTVLQDQLHFTDGCSRRLPSQKLIEEPEVPDDCSEVYQGIMLLGLHGAFNRHLSTLQTWVLKYNQTMTNLLNISSLDQVQQSPALQTSILPYLKQEVGSETPKFLLKMTEEYLSTGITYSSLLFLAEVDEQLYRFATQRYVVTVIMIIFLISSFFLIFLPMLSRVDVVLKRMRSCLLLVPLTLYESQENLSTEVRQLYTQI